VRIVFDFDGTLVDSMPALRALGSEIVADAYGLSLDDADKKYMKSVGRTFRDQLELIKPGDPINSKASMEFYAKQQRLYDDVRLHAGVIETIEFLNTTPIKYGVCSSTHGDLASNVVRRLLPEFRGIVTGRDYGSKFSQLKSHFGSADKRDSWFIGDTSFDGTVASEANVNFIAVRHTFNGMYFKAFSLRSAADIPTAVDEVLREDVGPLQTTLVGTEGRVQVRPQKSHQERVGRF